MGSFITTLALFIAGAALGGMVGFLVGIAVLFVPVQMGAGAAFVSGLAMVVAFRDVE